MCSLSQGIEDKKRQSDSVKFRAIQNDWYYPDSRRFLIFCCRAVKNKFYERGVLIGIYYRTFIGTFIGVCIMCMCNAAAKADEQMEDHINDKNKK